MSSIQVPINIIHLPYLGGASNIELSTPPDPHNPPGTQSADVSCTQTLTTNNNLTKEACEDPDQNSV